VRYAATVAHDPVAYSPSASPAELEELLRSLSAAQEGKNIRVGFACPRCKAEQSFSFELERPVFGFDVETLGATVEAPRRSGIVDVICDCGQEHDGRGDDQHGCGFAALVPAKTPA
jgi:hypothetical protein